MAIEVYAEPFCRRHYARTVSGASLFRLLGFLGNCVLAFVIAYSTGDFWQHTSTFQEQPRVSFTNDALIIFQGATTGDERVWSSYPALNAALGSKLVPADVSVAQRDLNYDGKTDVIDVTVTAHGLDSVLGIKAILQFNYGFSHYLRYKMKGLAFVEHTAGVSGSSLYVDGFLRFQQLNPLKDSGSRSLYDVDALSNPAVGSTSLLDPSAKVSMQSILASYLDRNETTLLQDPYKLWTSGPSSSFTATIRVRIPPKETVTVRPHIFEMLKFGWIQWLATYVILWYLFSRLEWAVFHFRVMRTFIKNDVEKKEHTF